jgi:hypothetical protein
MFASRNALLVPVQYFALSTMLGESLTGLVELASRGSAVMNGAPGGSNALLTDATTRAPPRYRFLHL